MALAKKNSRSITHLGIAYRFTVFGNSGWNDLTIQHASGAGQKLVIQFPAIEKNAETTKHVITPAKVAEAIDAGLDLGWTSQQNAQPMRLRCKNGTYEKLP